MNQLAQADRSVPSTSSKWSGGSLVVWQSGGAAREEEAGAFVTDVLKSVGSGVKIVTSTTDPDKAEASLREGSKARRLLVLCPSPIEAICRKLEAGTPPSALVQSWAAEIRIVLGVVRRNRPRAAIVVPEMVAAQPAALLSILDLPRSDRPLPTPPAQAAAAEDRVLALLAAQVLASHPTAQALADEVEASALDLPGTGLFWPAGDLDSTFQHYLETRRAAASGREEAALLLDQIRELQGGLEESQRQLQHAQQDAERGYGEAREAEARAARLLDKLGELEAEQKQLRRTMQERIRVLSERAAVFEAQHAKLKRSSSWRISAPLREVGRGWRKLGRLIRGVNKRDAPAAQGSAGPAAIPSATGTARQSGEAAVEGGGKFGQWDGAMVAL